MLPFTSVARVWPFWLVVGRCRVRIFFFFFYIYFYFMISVVEKGGGVRTPWTPPLDPPLNKSDFYNYRPISFLSQLSTILQNLFNKRLHKFLSSEHYVGPHACAILGATYNWDIVYVCIKKQFEMSVMLDKE